MPFELLIIRGKMLDCGDNALALNSLDVRHRQATREIGILSITFEIPTPQRSAIDVDRRTQNHVSP